MEQLILWKKEVTKERGGMNTQGENVCTLRFSDDITALAEKD